MTTRTVSWCTQEELDCAAELPTTVYLCVPASLVPDPVDDELAIVTATVTAVRDSKATDSCGACGYVYTFEYNDEQLVTNQVISSAYINHAFCKNCLTVLIESNSSSTTLEVEDSDTLDLTFEDGVLSGEVIISDEEDNVLVVNGGLYVPEPEEAPIQSVGDTESVDLTLTGTVLTADLIISDSAGNIAELDGSGLFVPPPTVVSVTDTASVNLTLTGTALSADVIISPNGGNALTEEVNGLYVPASSGGSDDGWIAVSDSWMRSSTNIITVPAGAEDKYAVGDRIRLVQSGITKYFFIIEIISTTLIRVVGDVSKTLDGVAISDIYYSHQASPVGLPSYFEWEVVMTANGAMTVSSETILFGYYYITANVCNFGLTVEATLGGVAANTIFVNMPTEAVTPQMPYPNQGPLGTALCSDNGDDYLPAVWRTELVGTYQFSITKAPGPLTNWTLGVAKVDIVGSYIFGA